MLDTFMIYVGIFMSLLLIPHILRMIKEKSSEGQSLFSISGYLVCYIFWLLYGIDHYDIPIIVCNSLSILFGIVYWLTLVYYRCKANERKCFPTALEALYERYIEFARQIRHRF
jgi:uncharacterized protein with PQ loop repeat